MRQGSIFGHPFLWISLKFPVFRQSLEGIQRLILLEGEMNLDSVCKIPDAAYNILYKNLTA